MDQHIVFLLFGLANGAIYAALALTLVVTYRSSGVINFSSGALALLGAYTYAFLRRGELLVPIPGLPKTVDLGTELGFLPAAAISVAICAVVGLLIYLLVFRPLRAVPPVGKAVASIGVMLVLSGLFTIRVGVDGVQTQPILPVGTWNIGGVNVTSDRVWFAIIIVAIAAALSAAYRFTRFGLLTRAAANSEKGAYVSGIKPDRIAAANWMISGAVAAIAGILISPILPLTPNSFTLLIVPALAAAVVAGFDRILPAVVAGIAIGMVQSDLTYLAGTWTWLPTSGRNELVVLLLILFMLVARAKPLPSRGLTLRPSLGRAPRPQSIAMPTLISAVVGVAALFLFSGDWLVALITSLIFGIISLSLVVVTGYAGQVSFAQLTLAGVAGFSLATLTESWGVPFPFAPLIAAAIAAVVGVIVGLPALRVRGLPVAIVTLATAVALEAFWFANSDFIGSSGKDVAGPKLFGLDLRARVGLDYPRVQFGLLVLTVLVLVGVGVAKLRMSKLGSQMLAVRANERSAAGAGVAVVRIKIIAFAIGSFIAGLGGSMLAYFQGNVTFVSFTTFVGLVLFATAYLAGITSISGGIAAGMIGIGGMVPLILSKALGLGSQWFAVIAGLGLVLTLIANPEGVVGPIHARLQKRHRDRASSTGATAPLDGHLTALEPATGGDTVLGVRELGVRYGGVVAVDGVDLDIREGTIVGLIGPNGAGKTTLLDALSGFTPSSGTVLLDGVDLKGRAPHQRVRSALGRTFQHAELYEDLSVHENV
ncbi:MAG: putative transporter ATP-binding protein, partial [Aeromicrobium sp.]|nr:putative transporter ATP-binding protein [Aeromicrobium sp.]